MTCRDKRGRQVYFTPFLLSLSLRSRSFLSLSLLSFSLWSFSALSHAFFAFSSSLFSFFSRLSAAASSACSRFFFSAASRDKAACSAFDGSLLASFSEVSVDVQVVLLMFGSGATLTMRRLPMHLWRTTVHPG